MNLPQLDWERCRSLLAILRTGSLSGAARALNVAHPTVRRHLEELEEAVGARLFVRSPAGLAATERALALREPAETMEAAFEHLVRTASAASGAMSGTVRITASDVVGIEVLPPILAALQNVHPDLVFEVHLSDDVENLLRNDADIAVRMARPMQSDLIALRAAVIELGLFAHRRWIDAHGWPVSLDQLLAERCMIGDDRNMTIISGLSASGVSATRSDFGLRSDSTLFQLAALRAGLGVCVCQSALAARDERLVRVLPSVRYDLEVWLVTSPAQRSLARIGVTLDALARGLSDYAGGSVPRS